MPKNFPGMAPNHVVALLAFTHYYTSVGSWGLEHTSPSDTGGHYDMTPGYNVSTLVYDNYRLASTHVRVGWILITWLTLLIGPIYLERYACGFDEDQKSKHHKDTCSKRLHDVFNY